MLKLLRWKQQKSMGNKMRKKMTNLKLECELAQLKLKLNAFAFLSLSLVKSGTYLVDL